MNQTINLIGHTPMYQIENTNIYVKLEKFNVAGSIKDRTILGMLTAAIEQQLIKENTVLIEATSGNTGIALAMLGAVLKIPVVIIMPETMSIERRQLIKAYGATLILSEGSKGMKGALTKMAELMAEHSNYLSLKQFENIENVNIHYQTTAVEIIEQVPNIDLFVACAGTGGSFTGIAKRLKEYSKDIHCVIGEPKDSAVLSGQLAGSHRIQGIGAGFIPDILDQTFIDDIMLISNEEAFEETRRFNKETGILVGISSGANIALAKRLAKLFPSKTIVTLSPDGGEKYLSVLYSEDQ